MKARLDSSRLASHHCGASSLLLSGILALGLVTLGCKPGPGSSCDKGDARCVDPKRELVCDDGKFIEEPCRGKAGCSTAQEQTTCDITGERSGDACSHAEEGVAACGGADAMIACHDGKFVTVACRGPNGCTNDGGRALCDQSVAAAGDACKDPDSKACASDKQQVLSCKEQSMQPLYACRGPSGCNSSAKKLSCDQTVAKLGDACDKGLEGHIACNEEHSATLACKKQSFTLDEKCKPGTKCSVEGSSTSCAKK